MTEDTRKVCMRLPDRVRAVAALVYMGLKPKQIARSLGIADITARHYCEVLYEALGTSDILETAMRLHGN